MKNSYSSDKTGLVIGLLVIAVGGFIEPLVMVLGGVMVLSGIMAYLVESYKSRKHVSEEVAEEAFFSEMVQSATRIPIR